MATIDVRVPHIARVYDYWLGGRDNFAADRELGEHALAAYPNVASTARANRAFLARSIYFLAHDMGIRQFIDIGTGLPNANNTHEVAQRIAPGCKIVYVDNDPIVLSHARALLKSAPGGACAYVDADLRDPDKILAAAKETLDLGRPVAVLMFAVLHFVAGDDQAASIVRTLLDGCAVGSFAAISHAASDIEAERVAEMARRANEGLRDKLTLRDHSAVTRLFGTLNLVEPGVVEAPKWRPHYPAEGDVPAALWVGIGGRI
jgi:SAM-dependent methyltransferase